MIRDKIVISVEQHLQHVLLREPNLTLAKTIDISRIYEISGKNALELQQASKQHQVPSLTKHESMDKIPRRLPNKNVSSVVNTTKEAKHSAQLRVVFVPTAKDETTSKQSARNPLCTN